MFSPVGSINFDKRSFRLNDGATASRVRGRPPKARRNTLEAWRDWPVSERLLERLASLLNTQL